MALVEADLGGAASLDSSSRAVFFKFDFAHLEYKRGEMERASSTSSIKTLATIIIQMLNEFLTPEMSE